MISAWLLLGMLASLVFGFVRLNAKAKALEVEKANLAARAHALNVRRRVLARRRYQLRSQRFATDCEHLTNLAVARLLTDRAKFLGINPLGGDDSRKAVA